MKESMYCLRDMLHEELEEICNRGMTAEDLETVHVLTDTIKNIYKIESMEESGYSRDNGYSRDGYSRDGRGDYSNGHYVRAHYSNRYSMSEGRDRLSERIRKMMDEEDLSPRDRECLERAKSLLK